MQGYSLALVGLTSLRIRLIKASATLTQAVHLTTAKGEAYRLTGLSVKTAMTVTASLHQLGLLAPEENEHLAPCHAAYPIAFPPALFSGMHLADKETNMLRQLTP